jgi:hypothetical protein
MKHCLDCKFRVGSGVWANHCLHDDARDVIGYPHSCYFTRDQLCGSEAAWFEGLPPKPEKVSFWKRVFS